MRYDAEHKQRTRERVLDEAVKAIRAEGPAGHQGKAGTPVVLSVVRPRKPDPEKLTLTRAVPAQPALHEEQYDNASILYLKPGTLTEKRVDDNSGQLRP